MTGSGTKSDPFVIGDLNDLRDVRLYDGAFFELGANIDGSPTAGWYGGAGFEPLDWPYPQHRRPSGDFSSVGAWTRFPVAPATNWDKVDDVDQDGDATYIRIDALGGEVLFTATNFNIPAGSTNIELGMEVISRVEAAGDADGRIYIRVNGINYETAVWRTLSDNVTYERSNFVNDRFATNPNTGLPWTVDDINGVGPNPLQAWGVRVLAGKVCRITKIDALVFCDPGVVYSFDGHGFTVDGLTINRALAGQPYDRNAVGLFRNIAGAVRNVNLTNCNIIGRSEVAGIGSQMLAVGGSITGCNVQGRLEATFRGTGGICAFNGSGSINDCHFVGTLVSGGENGGIASYSWGVPAGTRLVIEDCTAVIQINAAGGDDNAGIVAQASECDVLSCHAQGAINGDEYQGGIAGRLRDGHMRDCTAEVGIIGTNDHNGGLVGEATCAVPLAYGILRCRALGNVSSPGNQYVAGLVGQNSGVQIDESFAVGNVLGGDDTAGLVGRNDSPIRNSYALGNVNGGAGSRVGGLVGRQSTYPIENSYSAGLVVAGGANVGGLVGQFWVGGTAVNSFWDIETSLQTVSAGGTGLTTAEMKTLATFLAAGWDIGAHYSADLANGYPFLDWQIPGGSPQWFIFVAGAPPVPLPSVITLPATEIH